MIRQLRIIGVVVIAGVWSAGCDETFNPVKDYRPQMIVYGILNNAVDTQAVRVYGTYNAPGHNIDNQTEDAVLDTAVVRISDGTTVWTFQRATVPRWVTQRYSSDVVEYIRPGFRPRHGRTYTITVSSPLGVAQSTTRTPDSTVVYSYDNAILNRPQDFEFGRELPFYALISSSTYALYFRLFLDYEVAIPGGWEPHTIEIPQLLVKSDSLESYVGVYPALRRKITLVNPGPSTINKMDKESFTAGVYGKMVAMLRKHYQPPGTLRFRRARIVLYQVDEQYYKYTRIANGFTDANSVRTDEPDFTNITGGRGLFGAVTRDSCIVTVIENLGL